MTLNDLERRNSLYFVFFSPNSKTELTRLDDASEDGAGVDSGTVPASMAELVLALGDGVDSSGLDGAHHVDISLTDLTLLFDQSTELVALLLLSHVVHGRDRRYRAFMHTAHEQGMNEPR